MLGLCRQTANGSIVGVVGLSSAGGGVGPSRNGRGCWMAGVILMDGTVVEWR